MPGDKTEIRNHIRRLRFDHDEMTQDELAKQAGVTRHTIMALEAGKYFPPSCWPSASRARSELVWSKFSNTPRPANRGLGARWFDSAYAISGRGP